MMNDSKSRETGPELGDRKAPFVVRVFRIIVRLFLVALLFASLGAAAYFGGPAIYKNFIEPVQANSQRITDLENEMKQDQTDNRSRAAEIGERFAKIEGRQAIQQEAFSELQAEFENLRARLEEHSETINDLERLNGKLDAFQTDLQETADGVEALEASLAEKEAPVERLERQLQLVRVMELLTRARLWLTQSNFGLASEDVQAAMQSLEDLSEVAPEEDVDALRTIIERLKLALQELPDSPVIAADDLEVAWKLLSAATEQPPAAKD